jgi:hypothetical protein
MRKKDLLLSGESMSVKHLYPKLELKLPEDNNIIHFETPLQ